MSNHIHFIDGVSFRMKEAFDFSFLRKYGRVFKVFDDQDSGNICFGIQGNKDRYFIKFAGAPTARGCVSPETAITNLKATVPIYFNLKHPRLIELLDAEEIGGGFSMIFRWTDGECMGRQYPEAHAHFMSLPIDDKMKVFSDICAFLTHVADMGYTAIDFYDGSILYDPAARQTLICDIDFFRKQPCINDMGRMWGSSRFQAPEEYELGAALDEITNVYTLGATAFALFAQDRREEAFWPLSKQLYRVACTAVSQNRTERQQSIRAFMQEWKEACQNT